MNTTGIVSWPYTNDPCDIDRQKHDVTTPLTNRRVLVDFDDDQIAQGQ